MCLSPVAWRAWIRDHLREELTCEGLVHPEVYRLGQSFVETFDLDAMSKAEPSADVGPRSRSYAGSLPAVRRRLDEPHLSNY